MNQIKYLIANLKSNFNLQSTVIYQEQLRRIPKNNLSLIICPSTPFLHCFSPDTYILGAQDVSAYQSGSYTGEVSAEQLRSLGVKYIIIGHSERRINFQENKEIFIKKIKNAFASGLEVIFCIGENETDYYNNLTKQVLENQIATVFNEFTREELKNIIIAYEPVWSIGTNLIPSVINLEQTLGFISNIIKDYYELELPIIYGGSVTIENIHALKTIKKLNGFILGASSLDIEDLTLIVEQLQ